MTLVPLGRSKRSQILTYPQMTSADKDFRFMATNDLMSELQKDNIKLDDDSERKVVRMLLKVSQWDGTTVPERNQFNVTKNDFQLLEDKNGEVQNLAVRCLGPLVGKVKEYQVESIVDNLVLLVNLKLNL